MRSAKAVEMAYKCVNTNINDSFVVDVIDVYLRSNKYYSSIVLSAAAKYTDEQLLDDYNNSVLI